MTTIAVLADPPREGLVLTDLVGETPLSAAEAADLYAAALGDVLRAAERSGGDLLVNYRDEADLPASEGEEAAEAAVRGVAVSALENPGEARFEVQVGGSFSARAGNTATHLLREEGADSVAVVEPTAAFLTRQAVDSAAMKLRRSGCVIGPSGGGDVYYAGFGAPVDFADAYAPPAVGTLTDRALAADLDVDYLPVAPTVGTPENLATAVAVARARREAGRIVPERTTALFEEWGLRVREHDGRRELYRE